MSELEQYTIQIDGDLTVTKLSKFYGMSRELLISLLIGKGVLSRENKRTKVLNDRYCIDVGIRERVKIVFFAGKFEELNLRRLEDGEKICNVCFSIKNSSLFLKHKNLCCKCYEETKYSRESKVNMRNSKKRFKIDNYFLKRGLND